MNLAGLRSGMVRLMRKDAQPAPFEGLRERIGAYDVVYSVPGFDGSDGSWPAEDSLVVAIEATRDWPSDSSAFAAWRSAIRGLQAGLGVEPACATITGPGFTVRIAEWDEGDGWTASTTFAPGTNAGVSSLAALHSIAVRRRALTADLPREGEPNPGARPTWTPVDCAAALDGDAPAGAAP